eukprot:jgi/Mesvir1/21670/Mv04091-RA.1
MAARAWLLVCLLGVSSFLLATAAPSASKCENADYDLRFDLVAILGEKPECAFPTYLSDHASGTLCPDPSCGVDRPCCDCFDELLAVMEGAEGMTNLQTLAECNALAVGGCPLDTLFTYMRSCPNMIDRVNVVASKIGLPTRGVTPKPDTVQ